MAFPSTTVAYRIRVRYVQGQKGGRAQPELRDFSFEVFQERLPGFVGCGAFSSLEAVGVNHLGGGASLQRFHSANQIIAPTAIRPAPVVLTI